MFHGLDNTVLYSAIQITSRFHLDGNDATVSGTGFFVRNRHDVWALVTNRHVLDAGYKLPKLSRYKLVSVEIRFLSVPGDAEVTDLPTVKVTGHLDASENQVIFAQEYWNDVAAIVNPQFNFGEAEVRLDYFINHHVIADAPWINEKLTVCDFVAFPGFPPQHDKASGRPIFRTGSISSDPRSDYSNTPEFSGKKIAYEAFSFGGSSGSPVFALRKGTAGLDAFREAKLIGINAGHINAEVGHSGISWFIKSSVILEMLDDIPAAHPSQTFPEGFIKSI